MTQYTWKCPCCGRQSEETWDNKYRPLRGWLSHEGKSEDPCRGVVLSFVRAKGLTPDRDTFKDAVVIEVEPDA